MKKANLFPLSRPALLSSPVLTGPSSRSGNVRNRLILPNISILRNIRASLNMITRRCFLYSKHTSSLLDKLEDKLRIAKSWLRQLTKPLLGSHCLKYEICEREKLHKGGGGGSYPLFSAVIYWLPSYINE